jgi:hypothetical protein
VGIFFICTKKSLLLASLIFSVDETDLTAVQKKQPKILALKGERQIGPLTAA